MQLTPNGVKWITWFLSCCNKFGFQPTIKLFHQIFVLIRSNHLPLYELRFRAAEYDYGPGDAKPVIMQSSLKFLNGEVIFLKGLDLAYMPPIFMSLETEDFQPPILKDDALHHVFQFREFLGYQFTQDSLMRYKTLHNHGCKFLAFQLRLLYLIN